jgi:hypothetical protein
LTDEEFSAYAEQVQQILTMAESSAWEMFLDRCAVVISSKQQHILSGGLDVDEYRRESGFLNGALTILRIPDLVKQEFDRELLARQAEKAEQAEQDEPAGP